MADKVTIQTHSIDTDPGEIKRIYDELGNDAIEKIQPTIDEMNAKIYNYSLAFLTKNQKIMRNFTNTLNMQNRLQTLRQNVRYASTDPSRVGPAVIDYYNYFKNYMAVSASTQEQKKQLYENIISYQKEINSILNQTVKMTFVFEDSAEIIFIDSEELISNYFDLAKGKFRYNLALYDSDSTSSEVYNTSSEDYTPLKNTFKEVIWRYDRAVYRTSSTSSRSTESMKMILYFIHEKWYGVRVSSKGDVSEAYAVFALNHILRPFIDRKENIERQVQYFLFGVSRGTAFYRSQPSSVISKWNYGGVIGIDNESGFLAGDFSKDGIEYGIKGNDARSLGVKQIFDFAQDIVNKKGAFSVSDIQNWKNNAKNRAFTRNKLETDIKNTLHRKITNAINTAQLDKDLEEAQKAILNYKVR